MGWSLLIAAGVISDNVITQDTASSGITIESAQHLTVSGNDLTWTVPAPAGTGIQLRSVLQPADGIVISNIRIHAQLTSDASS